MLRGPRRNAPFLGPAEVEKHRRRPVPAVRGRGRQGARVCPVCGATVTARVTTLDLDGLAGEVVLSPHRPGGGAVAWHRGHGACEGSGAPPVPSYD